MSLTKSIMQGKMVQARDYVFQRMNELSTQIVNDMKTTVAQNWLGEDTINEADKAFTKDSDWKQKSNGKHVLKTSQDDVRGLAKWKSDAAHARGYGNEKLAKEIEGNIKKQSKKVGLRD